METTILVFFLLLKVSFALICIVETTGYCSIFIHIKSFGLVIMSCCLCPSCVVNFVLLVYPSHCEFQLLTTLFLGSTKV